ncbi:hypothetical protein [uncultured Mediterranean phage uvMED]|nr:hypothetical protein [uncultured Mediterranean phage uvMED]
MGGITDEFKDHFNRKDRLMRKSGSPGKEGFLKSGMSQSQVSQTYEKPISETRQYRTHGKQTLLTRGGGKAGFFRKLVNNITGNPLE